MTVAPLAPPSRLPQVGTTIFTVMSALAQRHQAINLGQGFPDFDCAPALVAAVSEAMQQGLNQYPPMAGVPSLRARVADKIAALYGAKYDPEHEITITAGATQAIFSAILSVVQAGDEVIVLEPAYDSYVPNLVVAGAKPVLVPLTSQFRVDWDAVTVAITPKTRAIVVNSPHNPTGTILAREDLQHLRELVLLHDLWVVSDEVYEHMCFDGRPHLSLASDPVLAQRSFVISSFGKTYHVTGWKVAYVAAPAALTAEFRKIHQFNVFTVNTPMQHGLAAYMADDRPYRQLAAFYQRKRDLFRDGLAGTGLRLLPCEGTYFQCVDYRELKLPERDLSEQAFCEWLTCELGVAAIPLSAFYQSGHEQQVVRFCFAKRDETLQTALTRLRRLA